MFFWPVGFPYSETVAIADNANVWKKEDKKAKPTTITNLFLVNL
jgi:hypothetical protein